MPITTTLDQVRFEVQDTNAARPLFTDDEINYAISKRPDGNVLLIAADLCDVLATRFARDYDFGWSDQQKFNRSQVSKQYASRAVELRARAAADTVETGRPLYRFPAPYPVLDI